MTKNFLDYWYSTTNHDTMLEWFSFIFLDDLSYLSHMLRYYSNYHSDAEFALNAILAMAED